MKRSAKPSALTPYLVLGLFVAVVLWFTLRSAPPPSAAVQTALVAKPASTDLRAPAPDQPPAFDNPDAEARAQFAQAMTDMMNDPQMQAQIQQRTMEMADNMYDDVLGQMDLTPDQADQAYDLLVQRMQAGGQAFFTAMQQGLDPVADQARLQQMAQQAQAQMDQSLRATIGTANFQQIQARDEEVRQSFQGGGGFPGGGG
jgi:hypothetical protein